MALLDQWRSARQLRNTRLARKAAQETARNTRPPSAADHQGAYSLGWSQGWDAGYRAAISDVRQGKVTP